MHYYAYIILSKTPGIVNRFSLFCCFAQRSFAGFFRFYFKTDLTFPRIICNLFYLNTITLIVYMRRTTNIKIHPYIFI